MSEKRITAGVVEMLAIIDDPTSTENERSMAATTIVEGVAPDILEAFVKATERERRLEDELTQWQQFASYCRCIEREYRELKLAVKAAGLRAVRVGEKLVVIGDSEPTPPAEPQTADADAWERASDELAGKIGWTDKPSEVERRAAIAAMTPSDEDFAFAETERLRTELTALREQLAAAERELQSLRTIYREADNDRLEVGRQHGIEAEKWKSEDDWYGWNYHKGYESGTIGASFAFCRIAKAIDAAIAKHEAASAKGGA